MLLQNIVRFFFSFFLYFFWESVDENGTQAIKIIHKDYDINFKLYRDDTKFSTINLSILISISN